MGADEGALLLAPCRDVHTIGMDRAIDLAFVDAEGRVVAACRGVEPGRRMRCRSAVATVERFAEDGKQWFEPGDRIFIAVEDGDDAREREGEEALR